MQGGEVESSKLTDTMDISTKLNGCLPQGDLGQSGKSLTHNLSIKKRSLRRAFRRMQIHGHTYFLCVSIAQFSWLRPLMLVLSDVATQTLKLLAKKGPEKKTHKNSSHFQSCKA